MRILVTGASGFVGRALVEALRDRHELRLVGRQALSDPTASQGCDAVVHLANIAHTAASEAELARVNVEGTRRVAEAAAANGVRRFVYLSSIKASCERTAERPADGTEPPEPTTPYGRSKLAAEAALWEIQRRHGLGVISLRPVLVFGPGVRANFLSLMRAVDSGLPLPLAGLANRRSFVFAANLADAIAGSVAAPEAATGSAYPIADEPAVSTTTLCHMIADALGRRARLFRLPLIDVARVPGLRALGSSLVVDSSRARDAIGWRSSVSLERALAVTAAWYRSR